MNSLVNSEEQFVAFFPLSILVNRGIVTVIGNEPVPKAKKKLPVFKCIGPMNVETKHVEIWWLWDGKKETKVGEHLTEEQQHFPTSGMINLPLLVEQIESGYRAIDDYR